MVVLGDPGAGKTTLLKYLTVICAEGQAHKELGLTVGSDGSSPLPIFVPLREFAAECAQRGEDYCLLDHLYTCAREHLLLNLPPGFFEEALDDGRCLVCLDGLDEVWAVGQRQGVRDAVKALAACYPRSRYLVTSRIVGYGEALLDRRDFIHHTILPFEDEDIRDFVRKWYEAREHDPVQRKQKADDLIATIEREPRIRSLAQNPLLLTIIALVHRIEADLPHERVKLYDKCVTALVETWEEVKGLSLEEKQRPFYRYRRRLLERLAYELHAGTEEPGQLRTVKEGDLELLLSRFLMENRRLGFADDPDGARDEARAFIHLARGRTGLLVERGEGVFGFPHLTFQEYLAACDIENRCIHRGVDAIWEEIEPRLHDPHWREVILLLLGSLNKYDEPPTLLVERILEAGEGDKYEPVLHRHLYLAARALADRVDVADDLHQQVVAALLEIARTVPRWMRGDAFTALSRLVQDGYAADGLLALAHDEKVDAEVRRAAAAALGQLGRAKEATEVLLAFARDPEVDAWLRRDAAQALGQLGRAEEAAEVLLDLARDPYVKHEFRITSIDALAQLGRTEEAGEILLALARNPKVSAMERILAASALGPLDLADESAEILLALACNLQMDSVPSILAIAFLSTLSDTEDKALNGLLALARDPQVESEVRSVAVVFLVQLAREDKALDGLLALARDSQVDVATRRAVALFLDQLDRTDDKALDGLLTLACDPQVDDMVRGAAARTLVQMGRTDEKLLGTLLALTRDPQVEAEVRSAAAEAVGQLGRAEEAEELLRTLTRDPKVEAPARTTAAEALRQLGCTKEAEEVLLTLARDPEVEDMVRCRAASALGQSDRADEAVEILLALARDAEVSAAVRMLAASRLGSLGRADESVDILLALARDPQVEAGIGIFAVKSLSELSRTENKALDGLLVLTCDPQVDDKVRGAAAEALGQLGHAKDEVLNGLLALLSDPQVKGMVRYQVTSAVEQLGRAEEKVLEGLLGLARDEKVDAEVRRDAYRTLKALVGVATD